MSTAIQIQSRPFSTQVAAFLESAAHATAAIPNLVTEVSSVGDGETRIPVSINSSERDNAWVCSPHTAYSRYAVEELQRFGHPLLTAPLSLLCKGLGACLWRARLDDAVAVNNWLMSTNLYPELNPRALRAWIDEAMQRWPRHAIWFRSLNDRYTADWLAALRDQACTLIPSRQVYLYDRIDPGSSKERNLRRDLQLLRSTELVASDAAAWDQQDFQRAAELYALLYVHKYSQLNPAYSAGFLLAWHRCGLLQLSGYRDGCGVLQAVVGLFTIGQTIAVPIVGYATDQPQRAGLYRLLMATVYDAAARSGCRINLSAGAAEFKRLRGGIGTIEYSAVCTRHLPRSRRAAVAALARLATTIGEPIMRRFEL